MTRIFGIRQLLVSVLLVAVMVLAGCARPTPTPTPKPAPTTPAPTPTTPAPAAPSVRITAPAAGATITGNSVTVSIEVSNFKVVPIGGANAPGEGHIHYYLDVEIPTTAGQPAVSAAGTYKAVPNTSATWENVSAGSHTFGVQLVNNNHTPLSPPVTARVTVTVAAAAAVPSVKIISPSAGATIPAGNVTVSIEVSNFKVVPLGGANAPGEGHIHYYMDVEIPTAAGQPAVSAAGTYKAVPNTSATWENVAAGSHTFGVQLVNSNHTPLGPPVTAKVTVSVAAGGAGATTPGVTIVSPIAGASVSPGSVTITVQVANFTLVALGGANAPGEGHLHYYMDVEIPTAAGQPAVTAAGTYKAVNATSVTWDNVAVGTHTFGVQLVNSNHTPLSPPVTAKVTVTVEEAAPYSY
ncbi:MAG: DUF4399 domain-containing protein [Chloroflexi bacterium]|nr:DUF4399 domain-containing protein [Chloroflexota bacterium]